MVKVAVRACLKEGIDFGTHLDIKISGDGGCLTRRDGHTFLTFTFVGQKLSKEHVYVIAHGNMKEDDVDKLRMLATPAQRIMDELHGTQIAVDGVQLNCRVWLCADLKFFMILLGLQPAPGGTDACCCIVCTCRKVERHDLGKRHPVRNIALMVTEGALAHRRGKVGEHGQRMKPVLRVPTENVVFDLMHAVLRLGDQDLNFIQEAAMESHTVDVLLAQMRNVGVNGYKCYRSEDGKKVNFTQLDYTEYRKFYRSFDPKPVLRGDRHTDLAERCEEVLRNTQGIIETLMSRTHWSDLDLQAFGVRLKKWAIQRIAVLGALDECRGQRWKHVTWYCHILVAHACDYIKNLQDAELCLKDFMQQGEEHMVSLKKRAHRQCTSRGGGRADDDGSLASLVQSLYRDIRMLIFKAGMLSGD